MAVAPAVVRGLAPTLPTANGVCLRVLRVGRRLKSRLEAAAAATKPASAG